MSSTQLINAFLPPGAKTLIRGMLSRFIGFVETDTWDEAKTKVAGYESSTSVDSIIESIVAARKNIAEADSLSSRDLQVISGISIAISELNIDSQSVVRIVDVGGAGGDYFFTLKRAMPNFRCEWFVVETPQLVSAIKNASLDNHSGIRWVESLEEIEGRCDIALLSSVLQYVEEPYQLMTSVMEIANISVINRIPLTTSATDQCAVQRVRSYGRRGAYPARFFSEKKFLHFLQTCGEVIVKWNVPEDRPVLNYREIMSRGLVLRHGPSKTESN